MAEPTVQPYDRFVRARARAMRADDVAPATLAAWQGRRARLREAMFAAMGPFPEKPCPLEPREVGVLYRGGYRVEKLLLQTLPDVWQTASAYVPERVAGKVPAVLVVHGHWTGARRDPVVQARCLGLVRLGFFVLAVDAFGAGERHPTVAYGGYHGVLLGSTLWPAGQTLLGLQVYENRRAVDYLCERPEVDAARLGITGASGGGNQTMYAGALDERFAAVVPVCSVGTYQAYLHAACCVCEVLPSALRFTEEGDVLGLVAPRALLVINATQDAFQFSVGEAKASLVRTRKIFRLHGVEDKVRHAVFESPHAYNQAMREAMYGWMTRWLKGEGTGKPIPEPKHAVDTAEDLACYPAGTRPATYVFPSTFAAREAKRQLASVYKKVPDHQEEWQALAKSLRLQLVAEVFGGFPELPKAPGRLGTPQDGGGYRTTALVFEPEPGLELPAVVRQKSGKTGRLPACVLLHLGGKDEALRHPLAAALNDKGWTLVAPDLRATGGQRPAGDAIGGTPDHNSAEHGLWIGRPLLGQWLCDVRALLEWMAVQQGMDADRLAVAGLGYAGLVALCAGGLLEDRVAATAAIDTPVTLVTDKAYPAGWPMGLLAPGILRVADVPHLAALAAPRRLLFADGTTTDGKKLSGAELQKSLVFPRAMYGVAGSKERLRLGTEVSPEDLAGFLGG
jgi:dienelactone hydrolase